jgi:hypothetical protein
MLRVVFVFVSLLICSFSYAQFSPPAGYPGSTAIYKDSTIFVGWATACDVALGWQNVAVDTFGKANAGIAASAVGKAGENGTVSLGDGGNATLSFAAPIFNGTGADFAVFENAFIDSFLEFAFVEVSSDGQKFIRFPAISNIQDSIQTPAFGLSDCSLVYNLVGTFRANFGTPFDLEDLKDSVDIDLDNIRFVRIVDVVGSIDDAYASYDINARKINDPWPTEFPSSGFDLDAVGVIHQKPLAVSDFLSGQFLVYPNPTNHFLVLNQSFENVYIFDLSGRIVAQFKPGEQVVDVGALESGVYVLNAKQGNDNYFSRFIKTD